MTMNRDEMTAKVLATIEKETGKKLDHWVKTVWDSGLSKHGKIRDLFKGEYGLSYGYANTLAHAVRDVIEGVKTDDVLIEEQYAGGKADLRPIYDKVITAVRAFGDDVEIAPKKSYASLRRKKQFAIVQPSTKTRMDIGLILKDKETTERFEKAGGWNAMCTHRVRVTDKDDIDTELLVWLKEAYEAAG